MVTQVSTQCPAGTAAAPRKAAAAATKYSGERMAVVREPGRTRRASKRPRVIRVCCPMFCRREVLWITSSADLYKGCSRVCIRQHWCEGTAESALTLGSALFPSNATAVTILVVDAGRRRCAQFHRQASLAVHTCIFGFETTKVAENTAGEMKLLLTDRTLPPRCTARHSEVLRRAIEFSLLEPLSLDVRGCCPQTRHDVAGDDLDLHALRSRDSQMGVGPPHGHTRIVHYATSTVIADHSDGTY